MSERYWISGAEIGTISALLDVGKIVDIVKLLEEIVDRQFIGNMQEPYSDYEIVIRRKNLSEGFSAEESSKGEN